MNSFFANLGAALKNGHISLPIAGAVGIEVAKIWFPAYRTQLEETQKALLTYGIIAAANSGPKPPIASPA